MTLSEFKAWLEYEPDTGLFRWIKCPRHSIRPGSIAGSLDSYGYIVIRFKGRLYKAHRLAWFMTHGAWPAFVIDHINADPADNRLANLRLATFSQNRMNERLRRNASGLKGVSFYRPRGTWRARIGVNGRQTTIGYYATPEQAHAAYVEASHKFHGAFARAA